MIQQDPDQKDHEIVRLEYYHNRCSQGATRPTPLVINNKIAEQNSHVKRVTSQNHTKNDRINEEFQPKKIQKIQHQQKHSFQKTFQQPYAQQPTSPWINDRGQKISHIIKKSDLEDEMSFSIEKGIEVAKPETYLSMIHVDHKRQHFASPSPREKTQKQKYSHVIQSVPYLKVKDRVVEERMNSSELEIERFDRGEEERKRRQIKKNQQSERENNLLEQINELKHLRAVEKISNETKQLESQKVVKDLTTVLDQKTAKIYKLSIKLKSIQHKSKQLHKFYNQHIRQIPEQLKHFKTFELVKIHQEVYDKLVEYEYGTKKWNQNCLENEYQKRKISEKDYLDVKKRVKEQQNTIFQLQQEKKKLQKTNRDLQFTSASSLAQQEQLQARAKKLIEEKSQITIELQTETERNKSLKDHISHLTKNVYNKSSKQGQEGEELSRKCNKIKKQLEEKEREIQVLKSQIQKLKMQEDSKLEAVNNQIRQIESKTIQYKHKLQEQLEVVQQALKAEQTSHQLTKQSYQNLQLKIKQAELKHYKQVETYDHALREIQKDLQILGMKKNLKEQELSKKEYELGKRQNELMKMGDDLRREKNELQCAIQLYKQNVLLLSKKQDLITNQYHETLEIKTQSKAAWYERYHKLYSPSQLSHANSNEKGAFSASNKFNIQSPNNSVKGEFQGKLAKERIPFVEAPYMNDVKKMAIKQRLSEIDNFRSQNKEKSQRSKHASPNNEVLSKPQSPRVMNLVHKAKSIETERSPGVRQIWKQRPERDTFVKGNNMMNLVISRSQSPKFDRGSPKIERTKLNKEWSVVRAKLDQIKSSISHEILSSDLAS